MTLGEAVDLVVEYQNVDIHITAHRMDEVITADGETVAAAG